jgi:PncC family amidohydrolase
MENSDLEIVGKVRRTFLTNGLRLAVAESCTGGLIGHMLTSEPGASGFFDSSLVCYSTESKHRVLGLGKRFLKKHGSISEDTARAMAEAAEKNASADVGLAITGNLGPKPVEGGKVGLVYVAVSSGRETTSKGFLFEGDRGGIKLSASEAALHFLFESISAWL